MGHPPSLSPSIYDKTPPLNSVLSCLGWSPLCRLPFLMPLMLLWGISIASAQDKTESKPTSKEAETSPEQSTPVIEKNDRDASSASPDDESEESDESEKSKKEEVTEDQEKASLSKAQDQAPSKAQDQTEAPKEAPTVDQPPLKIVQAPLPAYPEEAVKAGLTGVVRIKLTVNERGRVEKSQILSADPEGVGFEESTLDAVSQFIFVPKELNGISVQTETTHTLMFTRDRLVSLMKSRGEVEEANALNRPASRNLDNEAFSKELKNYGAREDSTDVLGLTIHSVIKKPKAEENHADEEPLPAVDGPVGELLGVVLERGSKRPIQGAKIILGEFDIERITDHNGRFQFLSVPIGEMKIAIHREGYASASEEINVYQGRSRAVRKTYLQMLTFSDRVLSGHHIPPRVPTRHDLSKAEILSMPGVDGDAVEAARDLPGIARSPFDAGPLVFRGGVRGGSYLLGSPMMTLSHGGGARSMLPSALLSGVEVRPDYGLDEGRFGGGVLGVKLIAPPRERMIAQWELNPYEAGVMVGGPLTSKFTLTGAARLGLMRNILELIEADQALNSHQLPESQDGHIRLTYREPRHRVDVLFSMFNSTWRSYDQGDHLLRIADRGERFFYQNGAQLNGRWTYTLPSSNLLNIVSASLGFLEKESGLAVDKEWTQRTMQLHLQDHLKFRLNQPIWLSLGIEQFVEGSGLDQVGYEPHLNGADGSWSKSPSEVQSDHLSLTYNPSIWAGIEGRWLRVHLLFGARVNYFTDTDQITPEPRLTLRYTPAFGTILKMGAGLYTQRLESALLDPNIGGDDLLHERHLYTSAGVEQRFTRQLYFDLTGFYRNFYDRLYALTDFDLRRAQLKANQSIYSSDGTGFATGAEALLRYDLDKRFYGWISYQFTYARLKDGPQGQARRSDEDQAHKLALVFGAKMTPRLSLDSRWRYQSGRSYDEIPVRTFDSDRAQDSFGPSRLNSARFSDFHELDLRLSYRFDLQKWTVLTYLQVNNLYSHRSAEVIHPLYGLEDRAPLATTAWPTWVSAGLRGTF